MFCQSEKENMEAQNTTKKYIIKYFYTNKVEMEVEMKLTVPSLILN